MDVTKLCHRSNGLQFRSFQKSTLVRSEAHQVERLPTIADTIDHDHSARRAPQDALTESSTWSARSASGSTDHIFRLPISEFLIVDHRIKRSSCPIADCYITRTSIKSVARIDDLFCMSVQHYRVMSQPGEDISVRHSSKLSIRQTCRVHYVSLLHLYLDKNLAEKMDD